MMTPFSIGMVNTLYKLLHVAVSIVQGDVNGQRMLD